MGKFSGGYLVAEDTVKVQSAATGGKNGKSSIKKVGRRDFIVGTASVAAGLGVGASCVPLLKSMTPSKEVLATSTVDVNLSSVKEGQTVTIVWQGKPVFIRHRTKKEIENARSVNTSDLKDKQNDEERVLTGKDKWLVVIGICTHLGCIPTGNKMGENRGEFGGWFCPCHGSHYDTSGRIRKGPAPNNLAVPYYEFLDDDNIRIGKKV